MTTKAELDKQFDELEVVALRVKSERDELLKTLKALVLLLATIRDLYQPDSVIWACKTKSYTNAVELLNKLCPR